MHDPMTVAFTIKYPWKSRPSKLWPEGYRGTFITIWHRDPGKDGTDDSCGWFMRSRHCDQATLERIARRYEYESCHGVPHGWFAGDGYPRYPTHSIVLGMFLIAANEHFGHWSRRAKRFLRDHTFEILHFADNNCDSLNTFITQHYGRDERETAKERAMRMAQIVYPWIVRADRPWWKHPRWHIHHWRWYFCELEIKWRDEQAQSFWQCLWPFDCHVRISSGKS